jgi:tetratricopeptide (TPR) repeat protein
MERAILDANQEAYDMLISSIENSQHRMSIIIAAFDDVELRDRIICRYETEAREANINSYRIVLGKEPSIRGELAKLKQLEPHIREGKEAVFTVTGAELLSGKPSAENDREPTELDKFYGYLQWTREGFQEFEYPIVIWVDYKVLKEMSWRSPDFWSWRKAVLRFQDPRGFLELGGLIMAGMDEENKDKDEFLQPPEEIESQIKRLIEMSPDSASLSKLYTKLGRVYARRIATGKSEDVEKEKQAAIEAYENALDVQRKLHLINDLAKTLWQIGNLHEDWQSPEANDYYQKSLLVSQIDIPGIFNSAR